MALVSGLLGATVAIAHGEWQVAVESAQVLAGTVTYPAETSFHTYHVKTWTLLHQVPALLLRAGLSADQTSLIVAATGGMLACQSIALLALALGARWWLAITAPVLYLCYADTLKILGAVYPLPFLGTPHTYGNWTLSFVLVALALLGRGHLRTAWFMLALAPAIHPALGAWAVLIVILGTLLDWPRARATWPKCWPAAAAGLAVLAASYFYQSSHATNLPSPPADLQGAFQALATVYPDMHRPRVPWQHPAVVLNLSVAALAGIWLWGLAGDVPRPARPLLAALCASGLLAAAAAWLTRYQEELPSVFLRAMPGRYLNVVTMAFPGLVAGLVGAYWDRLAVRVSWAWLTLLLLIPQIVVSMPGITKLLLLGMSLLAAMRLLPAAVIAGLLSLIAVGGALVLLALQEDSATMVAGLALLFAAGYFSCETGWPRVRRIVPAVILIALAMWPWGQSLRQNWRAALRTMNADPALTAARQSEGMLLTGSDLFLIQLKTGRPVLFCGGSLDMLPYVPEAGPDAQRVLAELYGIDLADPLASRNEMTANRLLPQAGKPLWERRTRGQWERLAAQYGFTGVLVYKDWKLNLTPVAESDAYRLYKVEGPR